MAGTSLATNAAAAAQSASASFHGGSLAAQAPDALHSVSRTSTLVESPTEHLDSLARPPGGSDFEGIGDLFDANEAAEPVKEAIRSVAPQPSHNQPSITGLRKSK